MKEYDIHELDIEQDFVKRDLDIECVEGDVIAQILDKRNK